jgi:hypothetical protein
MNIELYKLIIASSLHDMGKLLWRGGATRGSLNYKIAHAQYAYDFFHDEKKNYSSFWKEV